MKLKDISKASAVSLEWARTCELAEQRLCVKGGTFYERQTKRIARIDRQIAATAERHLLHLREQLQKHNSLGNALAASQIVTRIAEVEAMATETATSHREVEHQTELILRRAA